MIEGSEQADGSWFGDYVDMRDGKENKNLVINRNSTSSHFIFLILINTILLQLFLFLCNPWFFLFF